MGRRRSRVASKIALTIATDQLNGVKSVLSPANVHKHFYILKTCTRMKKGETAAHGCRKKHTIPHWEFTSCMCMQIDCSHDFPGSN